MRPEENIWVQRVKFMPIKFKVKETKSFDDTIIYMESKLKVVTPSNLKRLGSIICTKLTNYFLSSSINMPELANWTYEVTKYNSGYILMINNIVSEKNQNVARLIDTGHATRDGRWISGKHYIRPIIRESEEELNNELKGG